MLGLRRSLRASWSLCSSCCLGRSFAALVAVTVVVAARSSHVVSVSRRRPALARGLLAAGEETAVRRRAALVVVAVVVAARPSHVVSVSHRPPALGRALPDCGSGRLGRVGSRWLGHWGEEGSGGGVKAEAATTGRSCDGEKWAGLG